MKNNLQNNTTIEEKKLDWNIVQNVMKDKFGSDIFDSWLKKIELIDEYKNYVLISVSTRFIRDWITSRYLDQILQIVKGFKKDLTRIEFRIIEKNKNFEKDDINNILPRKSKFRSAVKKMNDLLEKKDKKEALTFLPKLNSELMKIAKTGVIKRENASRNISRITKKINSL